jgi:transcriptional regulator with XRE-family HTH domain
MDLVELGRHLRALRNERALTLPQLAEAASVSASMLSAVERGEKSPTITVLARIAGGLGVPLGSLVADPEDHAVIVRRARHQDVITEQGWQRVILSPVVPGVNFELIRSTLPPGCDPGTFPAYASGSHEYIAIEQGTLQLTVGQRTIELGAGDSLYFAADTAHRYANPGATPCTYYVAALIMRPRYPTPVVRSRGR